MITIIQNSSRFGGSSQPVYISHESGTAFLDNTITISKPSGISTGDLLLIIVTNHNNTNTDQWSSSTNIVSNDGFAFIQEGGNTTSDAHYAMFWKIADGTETSTIDIVSNTISNSIEIGFYIHIQGNSATDPIGDVGLNYNASPPTSRTLTPPSGSNGLVDLGVWVIAYKGEASISSVTGASWVKTDEIQNFGAFDTGVTAAFGIQTYSSAAAGAGVTITTSSGESGGGYVIRVKSN